MSLRSGGVKVSVFEGAVNSMFDMSISLGCKNSFDSVVTSSSDFNSVKNRRLIGYSC